MAEQGNEDAQYALGMLYENGQGSEKDVASAIEWYRKASERGHTEAVKSLDELTGEGQSRNRRKIT